MSPAAVLHMALASTATVGRRDVESSRVNAFRMLDVFPANDEIEMVRYRMRLHAPVTVRTIIVESSVTHSGHPKPLYMKQMLTRHELSQYNVRLLDVQFSPETLKRANCSHIRCAYILEIGQRHAVNKAIAEELAALDGEILVHSSDVDELLDWQAVPTVLPAARRVPQQLELPGPGNNSYAFIQQTGTAHRVHTICLRLQS